jgi:membrane associated rhomboid family serine protease
MALPQRFTDPTHEPVLNAPPVAVLTAASMPVLYWFQARLPDEGLSYAFRPSSLWDGHWWPGLITSMLVHGGWAHVVMNAIGALAFGTPVARLLPGPKGVAGFLVLYIVCGVLAAAGYGLVHPDSFDALVGASGAVFGLMGGAIRLLGRRSGRLRSLFNQRFLITAGVIMAVNAATGLVGLAPGAEGARIAWEAHAFGFVAGALLIGPLARMFAQRRETFDSSDDLRDPRS